MTPISTNPSRKRSRDETAFELEIADGSYFSQADIPEVIPEIPEIPEEEPIYGEGMVLLNPRTGVSISAESQTGTWYEEQAAIEKMREEEERRNNPPPLISVLPEFRPKLPSSRKSMRLSQSSINVNPMSNQISLPLSTITTTSRPASPPKSSHPSIDTATIALGIGWTNLTSVTDPAIQAAARGWARYLETTYPSHIQSAEILLKSAGLNAYLVRCQAGFYLFGEDLGEGRMVAQDWDTCLANLRSQPIVFAGEEVLRAESRSVSGPDQLHMAQHHSQQQHDPQETNGADAAKSESWADIHRSNGQSGGVLANGGMDVD